jgi:cell division protein FtsQ
MWEDEAPAEPRLRRVPQNVSQPGRTLPGMPLEMDDPDGEDESRPAGPHRDWHGGGASRKDRDWPGRPWWRPASTVGRAFLSLVALIVLGGLATSAYLLKTYLGHDEHFRITGASNIDATGLTEVSRAEILPVFGEDIGRNIFFVPLAERRKQLEEIPWIEKATVMRLLPNQIRVSVVERKPVAFVRQGQQIGLVDANGILLTMPPAMMAQHHYSFPVVTGIDAHDPPVQRQARMAVYQRLLAELDANGQRISEQISEIDLTDPEDAKVLMPEQGSDVLAHFGEDRFLERYQRYKAHINEWRQHYPKLASVDLRYDQQVVLEMSTSTNVAQTAADEQAAANAAEGKQAVPEAAEKEKAAGKVTAKKHSGAKAPVDSASSGVKNSAKSKASTSQAPAHQSGPAVKVKPGKKDAKPAGNGSAKTKAPAAKDKVAKAKVVPKTVKTNGKGKKHAAEVKRAALKISKRKIAITARPAAIAGEGQ